MKNFSDPSDAEKLNRSLTNITVDDPEVVKHFTDLRFEAKHYANALLRNLPTSREKSLAITKLEESLMWAIKGVVLHQDNITK